MIDKYINQVVQGDCLEVMEELSDNTVGLVLTDPQYGTGKTVKFKGCKSQVARNFQTKDNMEWNNRIPDKIYFDQMMRISKNQIIWGGNYFVEYLKNSRCWICWDKCNYASNFADIELAWTSFDRNSELIRYMWNGMMQGKNIKEGHIQQGNKKLNEKRYHPTQKPLSLIMWCLDKFSKEGDTIFDGFGGSGTTAVACIKMKRNYIIVEKEPKYCETIRQRIKQETDQLKLF